MTDASYIEDAASWTADIVRWKSRGAGDTDNALRAGARESGTSYSLWRKLRYEKHRVAGIYHDQFEKLRNYYVAQCERQEAIAARKREEVLRLRGMADAADEGAGTAHPMADRGRVEAVSPEAPGSEGG